MFRAVYGAATFPTPVGRPCVPIHEGQPSLWMGQGYGASPSHPHLPCAAAPRAVKEDKATVPVPIRALLLRGHHLQGCNIHRPGMGGLELGGSCLSSRWALGTPPLVPQRSRSQACPKWGLKPPLTPALFCCKAPLHSTSGQM